LASAGKWFEPLLRRGQRGRAFLPSAGRYLGYRNCLHGSIWGICILRRGWRVARTGDMYEPFSAKLRVPRFSRPIQASHYRADTSLFLTTTLLFVILSDLRSVACADSMTVAEHATKSGVRFIAPFPGKSFLCCRLEDTTKRRCYKPSPRVGIVLGRRYVRSTPVRFTRLGRGVVFMRLYRDRLTGAVPTGLEKPQHCDEYSSRSCHSGLSPASAAHSHRLAACVTMRSSDVWAAGRGTKRL
jgi:hypothetical protein